MSKITLAPDILGTGTFTIAAPNGNTDRTLTLPDNSGTLNASGAPNQVPAGTASAPAIYPTGDTNTGIFFPAADTIAFTEGGVEAARFDSGGRFGIGVTPSTAVPTSLQYARVGRRHMASGGMSGSTWVNTGITFTPSNSYCYVLVDALGNENGRNNGFRRYIVFYNFYSGWATTGAIINNQHGNDYGLVDVRYTSTLEVKAANNASGGPYFIYATEYLI